MLNRPVLDGDLVSAREVQILEPHLGAFRSPFRIEARETRKCQPGSEKFEQKYKDILRGQDGLFVVMLDRFGKRVPGTMKVVRQQVPGKSVTLRPDEEKEVLR